MNKIYRVIWNSTLRVFQVCSELVNGKQQVSSVSQPPPHCYLFKQYLLYPPSSFTTACAFSTGIDGPARYLLC
ncbi:TPA: ESPR domain-containing protein [Citrobacter amalonaticus]|nr:ESPR domain-containing protein [Citrobacter amalonaticus]